MFQVGTKLIISIMKKIQQTEPSKHMSPLKFKCYPTEPKLCMVTHISIYLTKTKCLIESSKLFVSYIKCHRAITKETLARWCKNVISKCGVDMSKYSTHSCRSAASSSKANSSCVPLKTILDSAGWASEKTFARHYNKPIDEEAFIQDNLLP